MTTAAPYGSWVSPITAASLTADSVGLGSVRTDGTDVYWLEGRATERGRQVLVRAASDGTRSELTPAPFNVRTRVHEYGGGAYAVHDRTVVFSNFVDGRLYRLRPDDAEPKPITVDLPDCVLRFADLTFHPSGALLYAVREDHRGGEVVNTLVRIAVDTVDQEGEVVADGHDFFAGPRCSADGHRLAFLSWEHPDMPWDSTVLWTAGVSPQGEIDAIVPILGHESRESLVEPGWLADGRLMVMSDRSDWWNPYLVDPESPAPAPVHPADAEFAGPAWVFGGGNWAQLADGRVAVQWRSPTTSGLGLVDVDTGELTPLEVEGDTFGALAATEAGVAYLTGSATAPAAIVRLEHDRQDVLRQASELKPDPGYLSIPEHVSWPSPDGATAHGWLYRPANADFRGPENELPPLLVCSHGGPTGAASAAYSAGYQFWTTRGFAVLDVDYGGSTGYGRPYRERLKGRWGIVDVDDCCAGADFLAAQGIVDARRMAIRGGSAGGFTTLAALAFQDTFAAGASYFGVGDLAMLARDTHKFESRYLDGLVGPYPQAEDTYLERSPLHHVEGLNCPIILLQGAEDRVVPPNQAHAMADALRAKDLPVALIEFAGEGHGFRMAETIIRAQEAELSFYGQIFGFVPADLIEPVQVENLTGAGRSPA